MGELRIWMNGVEAATWQDAQPTRLTYASSWLASPLARPLSLSLPLLPEGMSHRGDVVEHYFDNLLPDSANIRARLRNRFTVPSNSTFALLEQIGRDCVGAIQLLPVNTPPDEVRTIQARSLDEAGVARLLGGVASPPLPGHHDDDEFRLSLAGAQEKTALLVHNGQWCVPLGSTPSTHIFKLPLGLVGNMRADMASSVENEWLCMQLLRAFGLPVANTTIGRFEDQRALVVERFDRRLSEDGTWWIRLPQEDLCQVFGLPSSRKYESDGGPGIVQIMDLLRQSAEPGDRETFFRTQILFWLLAATDGHAKNFSLHIEPQGRFRLTPLYDVLSVYPILGHGPQQLDSHKAALAMSVVGKNRHRKLLNVRRRHWNETARACGVRDGAEPWIQDLLEKVEPAIASVAARLPADFPGVVAQTIFDGLRRASERLRDMAPDH